MSCEPIDRNDFPIAKQTYDAAELFYFFLWSASATFDAALSSFRTLSHRILARFRRIERSAHRTKRCFYTV